MGLLFNFESEKAAIGLLKTAVGCASLLIGKAGKDIAQSVTEDELGLQAVPFDQTKHGFDRILQGPSGQIIVLESKVSITQARREVK